MTRGMMLIVSHLYLFDIFLNNYLQCTILESSRGRSTRGSGAMGGWGCKSVLQSSTPPLNQYLDFDTWNQADFLSSWGESYAPRIDTRLMRSAERRARGEALSLRRCSS